MENNQKQRFGNLDLLRFVAMWGVITTHYIGWGGVANNTTTSDFNFYIAAVLGIVSQVSVNIFYIISGYFLEANKEFRWKKTMSFYVKVLFYSFAVPLALLSFGLISFDKSLVKSFFPILTNQYWFATIYLFLMLLMPFLNILFKNCSDKQLNIFLIAVFAFDSVQPMFFHNAIGESGYGITHAVLMVSLGYWIKRTRFSLSKIKSFLFGASAIAIGAGINLGWLLVTGDRNRIITDYNSPFIIVASCLVFLFFLSLKPNGKGFFTKLSPYIFAVYLVNDNPHMRAVVYEKILHCDEFYKSPFFLLHYVLSCIFFFAIGLGVDFLYETVAKYIKKIKDRKTTNVERS